MDYFSKYPFLFKIFSATMTAFTDHPTKLFTIKVTPLEIFMDNGQSFNFEDGIPSQINIASNIPLQAHTTLSPTASLKGMSTL